MPLDIESATRIVRKNFDRMTTYSDYLQRANLYIYVHESNLYKKILYIYEVKKKQLDGKR